MSSTVAPPSEQIGPAAWFGPDMAARTDWRVELDDRQRAEVRDAARCAIDRGLEVASVTSAQFPLPRLGPVLARVRGEVLGGRGFALLRGLSLDGASPREIATAFFGIGSHLGNARAQNAAGHVLGHVADLGLSSRDPAVRIYQTRERQTFHTDSCDVVGLLCVRKARAGGLSALVSSTTIFNEMRRRRPDLVAHLFEPIATDRRGEVPPGMDPWFEIPVFSWHEGHLTAIYHRPYIDSAQRFPGAPRLTDGQREALDLFDRLADDPALHFHMELEPGDVQLVHNHTILHDRTAFEDRDEPGRGRHLLRLWLSCPDARPLPPVFAQRYGGLEPGERGGNVLQPGAALVAPLEPG